MYQTLFAPNELASPDNTASACSVHSYSLIFSTAATRYNNLIVPNRLRQSQLRSRPSPSQPHSLARSESRLLTLFPEQQAVSTREVHLLQTCDRSAVLHLAYLVDFVTVPSLVPWYVHSRRKEPMVRRRLDPMRPLSLCLYMLLLSLLPE